MSTLLRGALLVFLAGCSTQDPGASPNAPDGPSPLEQAAAYSAAHAGDALVVWADGAVALEQGQNGFDVDTPHFLASGTKSFAGVAALAAVEDGLFTLDERVAETLTEWRGDSTKSQVTVRQLLHLTSGLDAGAAGEAPTFDEALRAEVRDPPGTTFRYGPTAFQVFGALLRRALGGESPLRYYERRIFAPLGIEPGRWTHVNDTDPQLAGGAWLTARDWLRFGRLLLQDGRWDGEQVLPAGLLDSLTTPTAASPGYGLTVWLNAPVPPDAPFFEHAPPSLRPDGPQGMVYDDGPDDLFMAAGLFNQRLYVIPSREMVVVRFGRPDRTWSDAEFLARLLDGRAYEASARQAAAPQDRVALITTLRMRQLDRAVDLTEAQAEAIRPAVERKMRALTELRARRDDGSVSRRVRRRLVRRLRQLQRSTDRAIEAELRPDQVDAYRAFRAEQRERLRETWRR
jgi:CubicO group peptidase (beta-lactamase class C family)